MFSDEESMMIRAALPAFRAYALGLLRDHSVPLDLRIAAAKTYICALGDFGATIRAVPSLRQALDKKLE